MTEGRRPDPAVAGSPRHTASRYERLGYEEVGLWPDEYLIVPRGATADTASASSRYGRGPHLLRIGSPLLQAG